MKVVAQGEYREGGWLCHGPGATGPGPRSWTTTRPANFGSLSAWKLRGGSCGSCSRSRARRADALAEGPGSRDGSGRRSRGCHSRVGFEFLG